jgi:hypothetical protein
MEGNNVAVAVDPTLRVVKGAGQKRPRVDEAQQKAGTAAGEPAVSQQGGGKRQKTSGGGGGKKKGGKKGGKNNKKKDNAAKQDKLKVGGGLELLDAELLGPEEQATFVQAQYRAADPTLAISAGQSLPSGTPSRPFFFIFLKYNLNNNLISNFFYNSNKNITTQLILFKFSYPNKKFRYNPINLVKI